MVRLKGCFYNGQTAESHTLQLELDEQGILSAYPPLIQPIALKQIKLSSRIGNIPRKLTFPTGEVFETTDHDTLECWLDKHQIEHSLLHKLESSTRYALGAFVFMLVFIAGTYFYGIPWFSKLAADKLPVETSEYIGRGTMETMDDRFFAKSKLGEERQRVLTEQFMQLLANRNNKNEIQYKLLFRHGGFIGANAFALPDGTVVVTDELVKLATNDEEILSILLHEMGHVEHRHSLRRVISHSGLAIMTVLITGDVSSAGELILALPNILMDSSYSRDHEWEADGYALSAMQQNNIPASRFADIMERLEPYNVESEKDLDDEERPKTNKAELDDGWLSYMSSHPASKDRIARFRAVGGSNYN